LKYSGARSRKKLVAAEMRGGRNERAALRRTERGMMMASASVTVSKGRRREGGTERERGRDRAREGATAVERNQDGAGDTNTALWHRGLSKHVTENGVYRGDDKKHEKCVAHGHHGKLLLCMSARAHASSCACMGRLGGRGYQRDIKSQRVCLRHMHQHRLQGARPARMQLVPTRP
jgi:hypothetical protein